MTSDAALMVINCVFAVCLMAIAVWTLTTTPVRMYPLWTFVGALIFFGTASAVTQL